MKIEDRMRENFPEDPTLAQFSRRFIAPEFDPRVVRVIVSPATQTKPKVIPIPSIEVPRDTPPKPSVQADNSPKRPLPLEDSDTEVGRPRKMARGESPLKGAAGRRLDQQRRARQNETPHFDGTSSVHAPPPPSLPPNITFFLSILPKTQVFNDSGTTKISPVKAVQLLRDLYIPSDAAEVERRMKSRPAPLNVPQPPPQTVQHPPPLPQHLNYGDHANLGQHMPPMPPMPPQQYGQYNGGYPLFLSRSSPPPDPRNGFMQHGGGNGPRNGYGQGFVSHPPTPSLEDGCGPSFAPANPPPAQTMAFQNPFGERDLTGEDASAFNEEAKQRLRAHSVLLSHARQFLR